MGKKRSKACFCNECGGTSFVMGNLDTGKIEKVAITPLCKWPKRCPEVFARGVFDRQFGSKIIIPTTGSTM